MSIKNEFKVNQSMYENKLKNYDICDLITLDQTLTFLNDQLNLVLQHFQDKNWNDLLDAHKTISYVFNDTKPENNNFLGFKPIIDLIFQLEYIEKISILLDKKIYNFDVDENEIVHDEIIFNILLFFKILLRINNDYCYLLMKINFNNIFLNNYTKYNDTIRIECFRVLCNSLFVDDLDYLLQIYNGFAFYKTRELISSNLVEEKGVRQASIMFAANLFYNLLRFSSHLEPFMSSLFQNIDVFLSYIETYENEGKVPVINLINKILESNLRNINEFINLLCQRTYDSKPVPLWHLIFKYLYSNNEHIVRGSLEFLKCIFDVNNNISIPHKMKMLSLFHFDRYMSRVDYQYNNSTNTLNIIHFLWILIQNDRLIHQNQDTKKYKYMFEILYENNVFHKIIKEYMFFSSHIIESINSILSFIIELFLENIYSHLYIYRLIELGFFDILFLTLNSGSIKIIEDASKAMLKFGMIVKANPIIISEYVVFDIESFRRICNQNNAQNIIAELMEGSESQCLFDLYNFITSIN